MSDVHQWKTFEDTTTRNVNAILDHANETRKMFREVEKKVEQGQAEIRQLKNTIEDLRTQISKLQQKVYAGGT